jgi:biotin carboxyl carrier protein
MPRYTLIPASFSDARSRSSGYRAHASARTSSSLEPDEKLTCDIQFTASPTATNGNSGTSPAPQLQVTLGERVLPLTVLHAGPPVLVSLEDRVFEVVQDGPDSYRVVGSPQTFRVVSRRTKAAANVTATDTAYAPMPGRIVKVLCRAGDVVAPGTPLVVLEAMKMENELAAPRGGLVAEIFVKEGDAVEARAKLVKLTDA